MGTKTINELSEMTEFDGYYGIVSDENGNTKKYKIQKPLFEEGSAENSAVLKGTNNTVTAINSVALGGACTILAPNSFAEGANNTISADTSHAEGANNTASGRVSHVEGRNNSSSGQYAHAEGGSGTPEKGNIAEGNASHAEGTTTRAYGNQSHSEGLGTIANTTAEHAQGKYNKSNTNTIHSVGIGTSDTKRKNAHEIMLDGKHYILGIGGYDGTNPSEATDLATYIKNLETQITSLTSTEN